MNKEVLQKIKNATFPDTEEGRIFKELQTQIGEITNNFTEPGNLSSVKIDMTKLVEDNGLTVAQYEDYFGSIMRSEEDVANNVAGYASSKATASNDDKAKKLKLAKARSRAAKAKLALLDV